MDTGFLLHRVFPAALGIMAFVLLPVTAIAVSFISAPYGRHFRAGWGFSIPARAGWILMESPALWMSLAVFSFGQFRTELVPRVLLAFYLLHYLHRVVVYPLRAKLSGKSMPASVALLAFVFNVYNGYLQACQISHFSHYDPQWLQSAPFVLGASVFVIGFGINVRSDSILMSLRKGSRDGSYKVPHGFLYDYISCPNYFGEIVEWGGWAILTRSKASVTFFLYTIANLAPRALANHQWYLSKFEDYPQKRKALIPFIL